MYTQEMMRAVCFSAKIKLEQTCVDDVVLIATFA